MLKIYAFWAHHSAPLLSRQPMFVRRPMSARFGVQASSSLTSVWNVPEGFVKRVQWAISHAKPFALLLVFLRILYNAAYV